MHRPRSLQIRGRNRGPRWLSAPTAAVAAFTAAIAVSGCTAAVTSAVTHAAAPAAKAGSAPAGGLASYVNPLIGTNPAPNSKYGFGFDTGDVYPGAVAPHGMVAWSPDTTSGIPGGYWYPDNTIKGFSLNHFSGRGCPYEGDIPLMPVSEPVTSSPVTNPSAFQSTFSHSNESASPGYYQVASEFRGEGRAQRHHPHWNRPVHLPLNRIGLQHDHQSRRQRPRRPERDRLD